MKHPPQTSTNPPTKPNPKRRRTVPQTTTTLASSSLKSHPVLLLLLLILLTSPLPSPFPHHDGTSIMIKGMAVVNASPSSSLDRPFLSPLISTMRRRSIIHHHHHHHHHHQNRIRWPFVPSTNNNDKTKHNGSTTTHTATPPPTPRRLFTIRGGSTSTTNPTLDDERYSRQFYTLGARAHSLVRSSVVLLDGPPKGGLVYETVKNLALSGVGTIVLLVDDDDDDDDDGGGGSGSEEGYYEEGLDDLGRIYRNGARVECRLPDGDSGGDGDGRELLLGYIQRLNPSIRVASLPRSQFLSPPPPSSNSSEEANEEEGEKRRKLVELIGPNPVLLAIDRPEGMQVKLDHACRSFFLPSDKEEEGGGEGEGKRCIPFVSIETAGTYGRVFCDFGDGFRVVDEDGETPRSTLIDSVSLLPKDDDDGDDDDGGEGEGKPEEMVIQCVEGEQHDVSKGDVIDVILQNGSSSETAAASEGGEGEGTYRCRVTYVKSPTCITVTCTTTTTTTTTGEFLERINGNDGSGQASFQRIKLPQTIPFRNMEEVLSVHSRCSSARRRRLLLSGKKKKKKGKGKGKKEGENDTNLFCASDLDKSYDTNRRDTIMACFRTLDQFVGIHKRLPSGTLEDIDLFSKLLISSSSPASSSSSEEEKEEEEGSKEPKPSTTTTKQYNPEIIHRFARYTRSKFTPLQALYGALGAQEALKATSGLYIPIRQFLLYDCDEVLVAASSSHLKGMKEGEGGGAMSSGIGFLLGDAVASRLASKRIFVVGAGAIGCEILKNLAAMGAGTSSPSTSSKKKKGKKGSRGSIILTDMDTIEKSNLSRQLLFRDDDVGKFKSEAAKQALGRLDPRVEVRTYTSKVGDYTSPISTSIDDDDDDNDDSGGGNSHDGFDTDKFWSSQIDLTLNALDNVNARLYVDSQCVLHRLPLIDAGTLGSKGNVQVIIPHHKTESYGSSVDPPEPSIPVCTLKNFPYEVSHTIQWAKDLFEGLFGRRMEAVRREMEEGGGDGGELSILGVEGYARALLGKLGEDAALEFAEELEQDITGMMTITPSSSGADDGYISTIRQNSIRWAVDLVERLYVTSTQELLEKHPLDSLDEEGDKFWSGTRRAPKTMVYVGDKGGSEDDDVGGKQQQGVVDGYIVDFVRYAARLRIEAYLNSHHDGNNEHPYSEVTGTEAIEAILQHQQQHKQQQQQIPSTTTADVVPTTTHASILQKLTAVHHTLTTNPLQKSPITTAFEKDSSTNGHVPFLTASSNLRAISYSIAPSSALETRRIAGKIVPAMITTTAFVSALSCLELVKLVARVELDVHRNGFVNLALPFFAYTIPLEAEVRDGIRGGVGYTIWDRILVKEAEKDCGGGKGISLGRVMGKVLKKVENGITSGGEEDEGAKLEIASVSYGPYLLYANFLNDDDDDILRIPLVQLIKDAIISGDDDDTLEQFDDYDDENDNDETHGETEKDLTQTQLDEIQKLESKSIIELDVLVEDTETFDEVELPPVRVVRWNDSDNSNSKK